MNKTILILIIVAVILGLGTAGYFYWKNRAVTSVPGTETLDEAGQTAQKITESATQGVLPELGSTNPLEDKPEVNPVEKTNPFSGIKTNPFK